MRQFNMDCNLHEEIGHLPKHCASEHLDISAVMSADVVSQCQRIFMKVSFTV